VLEVSLVFATRSAFHLVWSSRRYPPLTTRFSAPQSSSCSQWAPADLPHPPHSLSAGIGKTHFPLESSWGKARPPAPLLSLDSWWCGWSATASCLPRVSEPSLWPSLAIVSTFPSRRRAC